MRMIPDWNTQGLLPPIRPGEHATSLDRSPFRVSIVGFVERFATSPERIRLLEGLLSYREALSKVGIHEGFQWIDGSFVENIEVLESRHPRDIDCITFYKLDKGCTQQTIFDKDKEIFNPQKVKTKYGVDARHIEMSEQNLGFLMESMIYWQSVWSHRRDNTWKGFVHISVSQEHDNSARKLLATKQGGGRHDK